LDATHRLTQCIVHRVPWPGSRWRHSLSGLWASSIRPRLRCSGSMMCRRLMCSTTSLIEWRCWTSHWDVRPITCLTARAIQLFGHRWRHSSWGRSIC